MLLWGALRALYRVFLARLQARLRNLLSDMCMLISDSPQLSLPSLNTRHFRFRTSQDSRSLWGSTNRQKKVFLASNAHSDLADFEMTNNFAKGFSGLASSSDLVTFHFCPHWTRCGLRKTRRWKNVYNNRTTVKVICGRMCCNIENFFFCLQLNAKKL